MKTVYKHIISVISIVGLLIVSSCGDENNKNDDGPNSREKIISTQELSLDALGSTEVFIIDKLISAITDIDNTADWITITIPSYSSGAPKIEITWKNNDTADKRVATVLLKTAESDQITLTINQDVKSSIDDIHNTQTDQPALSPIY